MSKQFISELKEGDIVSSFFGVFKKAILKTKTANEYIDITLMDSTGIINAKVWDNVESVKKMFGQGEAVAVKGQVVEFKEELQIKVNHIRRVEFDADKNYGFSFADLIPSTNKDVDSMWNEIQGFIQTIENPHLKDVVNDIFSNNIKVLKEYPASMILHHAYRGGFLEHLHSMSKLAIAVGDIYEEIDSDLLLTGVLLHDIGKLKELETGLITSYTDEGNFIGHLVLGRDMLLDAISKIDNFPEILKLKLEHIILSHQGKYEWHSPKEPSFLEALMVYLIDETDTRLNQMKRDIETDTTDGDWTSKKNYFRRPLYKRKASEE